MRRVNLNRHRLMAFPAMHKAWPDLYKRMKAGKIATTSKDRELVVSTRTWLCLYLFEHQYVTLPWSAPPY
jgi:hypothetical protein